jgi:hypothetical protein
MDCEAAALAAFSTVGGEPIILDPPACPQDEVVDIRRRVAAALGAHQKQVVLLYGPAELLDVDPRTDREVGTLGTALGADGGPHVVSVMLQPCRIRPSDYDSYIDREAVGFLDVDEMVYGFGHPATVGPSGGLAPSTDPQIVQESIGPWSSREFPPPRVEFPPPQDIDINMMPFIMGDISSVPLAYQPYWPLVERCLERLESSENGKVGYLTIQEGLVRKGCPQRRPGLHIESPGAFRTPGSFREQRYYWGCGHGGSSIVRGDHSRAMGGIFMASTVDKSCRVWDVQMRDPASVVGRLGDLEHVREVLGEGAHMEAGKLYWITDLTPHESLPVEDDTYRQFFRLVTSSLSAWYPENATRNPLGVEPDPAITEIVTGNKFTR